LENTNCVATCTNTVYVKPVDHTEKQRQKEQKDTHNDNKHYFIRTFM